LAGIDNGTLSGGVFFQAKQFGPILRGLGPPVPQAGVVGDLYIDTTTFDLYEKRATNQTDPWGHFLFTVPARFQSTLNWFTAAQITDDIGSPGDFALLWAGFSNYGLQPSIFGPKGANGWPENGNLPGTVIDPNFAGFALQVGVADESAPLPFSNSTQLVVLGVEGEFILAAPTLLGVANTPIAQQGLSAKPANVAVTLGTEFTATDGHAI
jgi:hypothetical protein